MEGKWTILSWQVRAELCIREIKRAVRHLLEKTKTPKRLWDYFTKYHCELRNITAHPIYRLHGRTPYKWVVGRTPDISEYIGFQWFETIWYLDSIELKLPVIVLVKWKRLIPSRRIVNKEFINLMRQSKLKKTYSSFWNPVLLKNRFHFQFFTFKSSRSKRPFFRISRNFSEFSNFCVRISTPSVGKILLH